MLELVLSQPPQKRNQTLLLSKLSSLSELAGTCRNFAGSLPELVGTVGTFGSWSFYLVALAPSLRFCFHADLPFLPQPPAPLQPTGGKQLMFALFGRNFAGTLPEPVGTVGTFGSWSF